MKISGEISQLQPNYGNAFFNIMRHEMDGGAVGVWGACYKSPTILAWEGIRFYFMQFSDEDWYQEWVEEEMEKYEHVYRIEYVKTDDGDETVMKQIK